MARYMVKRSFVEVVGFIWMPNTTAATVIDVSTYDIENMRADDGCISRASVDDWLSAHAGDFREIIDFHASIEDGETSIDIPWNVDDNECTFVDCMYPCED